MSATGAIQEPLAETWQLASSDGMATGDGHQYQAYLDRFRHKTLHLAHAMLDAMIVVEILIRHRQCSTVFGVKLLSLYN